MISAKDIMNPATPVILFSASVPEAIQLFAREKLDFVAVQADDRRYHGVISEAGLMRIYLRYKIHPEKDSLILYRDLFEPTQLISEQESFTEVVRKVLTSVGQRVFVIDSKSKVIGFIKARDILPFFSQTDDNQIQPGSESRAGKTSNSSLAFEFEKHSNLHLFENFFSQSPFMMHSINRQGEIQMANEILHRVLGYEYGELLGLKVWDLYPKSVHQKVKDSLSQIIDKGFKKIVKGNMVHKTNKMIRVEMVSRSLHDRAGKVIGTLTVARPLNMKYLIECMPEF